MTDYLAIDLGAESGRTIVGTLENGRLELTETYRFHNGPVILADGLHWDVRRIWDEIRTGIAASASEFELRSIGIDTWGIDFALLDRRGELLSMPFHYRDSRTKGMLDEAFGRMSREEIFELTGCQFLRINTLYQLLSMVVSSSPVLEAAANLLMIPDLFNYWLTGEIACEFTSASTTQCLDPRAGDWAYPLLEAMGIPTRIFGSVISPGSELGEIAPDLARELDLKAVKVVAPACHDTGSAASAVPAEAPGFGWISSGTWSIMGVDSLLPVITPRALEYNFTNEGGAFGDWRVSKNITGLWLIQECRRKWEQDGIRLTFDNIVESASLARPFLALIDVDYPGFLDPGDMPERIREFCRLTGQAIPGSTGEVARVVFESIALKYRHVLERLKELTGLTLEPLHIVGGGARNSFLNQLTADCTGHRCVAGPFEATSTGNILVQAMALGELDSPQAASEVVRRSFALEKYEPGAREGWDDAFAALLDLSDARS